MRNLPGRLRRLIPLSIAAGAIVAVALQVATAGASPATSPPIDPQSPAEGAIVGASSEGLKVQFSCPSFVSEEGEVLEEESEGEEGEIIPPVIGPPVLGGPEEYGVHFSTVSTVAKSGQLGTTGFGEAGEGEAEPIKPANVNCTSELELPTAPYPAALYEGRIYWQAFRGCARCADGVEVGPVRSFVVAPNIEEPEMIFREQIFAGYLTKVWFGYEAELGGAVVMLQEWEGSAWKTIAEAPGSNRGENTFFVKVKRAGHHLFRPLVVGGGPALGLEPAVKVIRKPTRQRVTSAADDGAYVAANAKEREEWPISFSVRGNGTVLRNLQLEAETTCKGPTKAQDVKTEVSAFLRNAKIAPDGTVFGVTKSAAPEEWTVTLTGSIFHGRFQGELTTSYKNCTGYRTIDAILKSSVKS